MGENVRVNLHFFTTFALFSQREGRLHLGKTQINLVFRSVCTTFAPVKRKSVAFILLSVLIMFGACTPLSLLHKGKKAVKEAESYVNAPSVKALAQKVAGGVAALENAEVPQDNEVPQDVVAPSPVLLPDTVAAVATVAADTTTTAETTTAVDTTAVATVVDTLAATEDAVAAAE